VTPLAPLQLKQEGDLTLEEKLAHAHKQASVALREPNIKPNLVQVPHRKQNSSAKDLDQKNERLEPKRHEGARAPWSKCRNKYPKC